MESEKIQVVTSDSTKEIIIREGAAPIINNPKPQSFDGHIDAPADFYKVRKAQVKPDTAIVVYNFDNGTIELMVDPSDALAPVIKGRIASNKFLDAFKINTGNQYGLKELMNLLRLNRVFFPDKDENDKVVSGMSKFKGKVTSDIESRNDLKGNKKESFEVELSHSLQLNFKLQMPLFKNDIEKSFLVDIMCDITDGNIKFWLESTELGEMIKVRRDELIQGQLESFDGLVMIKQ